MAFVVFVAVRLGARVGAPQDAVGACGCARSGRTRSRRAGSACRSTGRVARLHGRARCSRFLGAIVLLAQLGVGDPAQGTGYTLTVITAVVLGGTSLLGGRGTFIGTLLGAGLSVQVLNATMFLSLNQTWQYIFQGAPDRRRGPHLQPGASQRHAHAR